MAGKHVPTSDEGVRSKTADNSASACGIGATAASNEVQAMSLDHLSSELLALVFQQLRDFDATSLGQARLVSRRFEAIATPVRYETLRLTGEIIAEHSQTRFQHALDQIYAHTRHVEARSDLDPEGTKRLLKRINNLVSVRWRFLRPEFRCGMLWLPRDLLGQDHLGRTQLLVENLPLVDFEGNETNTYLEAIPPTALVSLEMASPTPPLTTRLESLKQLLLQARRLHTFHYVDRGQGTHFALAGEERLPAFEELVLHSYDWNHTIEGVERHWDFSRLRRLRLIDMPIHPFLTSVPGRHLANLEELQCEDYSAHLPDHRHEATEGLCQVVRLGSRLDTLRLTCHLQHFDVGALHGHAKTLRVLELRDHLGFGEESRRCPTLYVDDLLWLSRTLVRLEALELDMDVALCDPPYFLGAICGFPRLRRLRLHTQTLLSALEVVDPDVDRDCEAAMETFGALVQGKVGVTWQSITINVGGWKRRHMVRRLGEAWRAQNGRGVYAERCFSLESSPGGEVVIKEEPSELGAWESSPVLRSPTPTLGCDY